MIQLYGDTILEGEDPQKLADQLMKINDRLYVIARFLRKIGVKTGPRDIPSGDKY